LHDIAVRAGQFRVGRDAAHSTIDGELFEAAGHPQHQRSASSLRDKVMSLVGVNDDEGAGSALACLAGYVELVCACFCLHA
jgi:hypothetical protein